MAEGFFIHIGYHQYLIGTIVLNHCRDQSVIHQLEIGKINRRLKNCHIDPILLQASFRFIDIFFFEVIRGYSQNLVKPHQLCKVISDQSIADQHLCLTAGHCLNMAYLDPDISVTVIENGKAVRKEKPKPPKRLVNIVRCRNPRCISSIEEECDQIFEMSSNGKYRCIYCEQELQVKPE